MEDNIQTIIGVILSVFILFIFPVYMAYEKKDDVAYTLAIRYTEDFVNDVRNKGYITSEMLSSFRGKLASTGNSYDINLTHKQTRLDPITQYYKDLGDGKLTLVKTESQEDAKAYEKDILEIVYDDKDIDIWPWSGEATKRDFLDEVYRQNYEVTGGLVYKERIDKVIHTYLVSEEVYSTQHIEGVLATENKFWPDSTTENFICIDDSEVEDLESATKKVKGCKNIYTMNQNDYFNVTIKNTNTTPATAIYNMITANTVDNNTRIFADYGGTILNEKWLGKIDYTKAKHDNFDMDGMEEHTVFAEAKKFSKTGTTSTIDISDKLKDVEEYIVEFEAKPFDTTELRSKGHTIMFEQPKSYNIAMGGKFNDGSNTLAISVGLNGISLVLGINKMDKLELNGKVIKVPSIGESMVVLSVPMTISEYKTIRVSVQQKSEENNTQYIAVLYVDGERIAETDGLGTSMPKITTIGQGYIRSTNIYNNNYSTINKFSGNIRNVKIFY